MDWSLTLPNASWLRARSPFALSADVRFTPDTVAKVVLQWWSEILRAADATFV
jgi:hypothetical protein